MYKVHSLIGSTGNCIDLAIGDLNSMPHGYPFNSFSFIQPFSFIEGAGAMNFHLGGPRENNHIDLQLKKNSKYNIHTYIHTYIHVLAH